MDYHALERKLTREEGVKLVPYRCSAGHWTIGVGHKMSPAEIRDMRSISVERAGQLLHHDIGLAVAGAIQIFGRERFEAMAEPRQRALVEMVFQLGTAGVAGFVRMVGAIFRDDWDEAADEALDSKWARKDTPYRARRVAEVLRTGVDNSEVIA